MYYILFFLSLCVVSLLFFHFFSHIAQFICILEITHQKNLFLSEKSFILNISFFSSYFWCFMTQKKREAKIKESFEMSGQKEEAR